MSRGVVLALSAALLGVPFHSSVSAERIVSDASMQNGLRSYPKGYWERKAFHAEIPCGKYSPIIFAQVRTADFQDAESRMRDFIRTLGAMYMSDSCQKISGPNARFKATFSVWIPKDALIRIQKEVFSLGKVEQWNTQFNSHTPWGTDDSVVNRWETLTQELRDNQNLLEKTPHVLSLVKDEIDRLADFAEAHKATKDKIPFTLSLYAD